MDPHYHRQPANAHKHTHTASTSSNLQLLISESEIYELLAPLCTLAASICIVACFSVASRLKWLFEINFSNNRS